MEIAIYRGPTRGYSLDDDDVLWLARGFIGEAGENCTRKEASALFHCWMDRFLLIRGRWLTEGWSFKSLLRAHSQPLNPLWTDVDGEKCQKHPDACTPQHIARRLYIQSLGIGELQHFGVYQLALEARDGSLERPTPEPLYDFASCSLVAKQGRPCTGMNVGGNCFLNYPCLKADEREAVISGTVQQGMTVRKLGITVGGVLFGGAVLWAAWVLLRKKRGN